MLVYCENTLAETVANSLLDHGRVLPEDGLRSERTRCDSCPTSLPIAAFK